MSKKAQRFALCLLLAGIALFAASCSRSGGGSKEGGDRPFYQIEVFDVYANYMGVNQGWWGKILKDTLNMELNIIAPNVAGTGDALYQTRTAAGNLGDLIIDSKGRMLDLQKAGLLYNMKPLLTKAPYVQEKLGVAYNKFAEMFPGDGIWALPGRVSVKSPLDAAGRGYDPEAASFIRFDWYLDIGAPEIKGADGLLDVLAQMIKAHPVNEKGDKTYAFSLFPDWDGFTVRAAREMLYCIEGYGSASDFIWMSGDGKRLTYFMEDNSPYYKYLKLYNKAYRMGLLDPDSSTQNWDKTRAKFQDGRIAFGWWSFIADSIFTRQDWTRRSPYAVVPITGGVVNNPGYNPYGLENNAYAIGSKAKYPERIMELLNWLCSPEGILIYNSQIEGLTYNLKDGVPVPTEFFLDTNPDKMTPEQYGMGGKWADGIQRLNYPLTHQDDPNELLGGYPINSNYWPAIIEINRNEYNTKWREMYQADNPLEMLKKRNMLDVTPGTDWTAPTPPSEIVTMRNQLRNLIQPAGWQMIYAATDAEFEKIWRDMKAQLNDFGYQEVIAYDLKNIQDRAASIDRVLKEFSK